MTSETNADRGSVASPCYPAFPWTDGQRTVHCADMLDVLPSVSVDVIVTDPPYGIGGRDTRNRPSTFDRKGKNTTAQRNTWHEDSEWDDEIKPEWCRAVCDAAPVVFWFGNWKRRREVEDAMPYPMRCEIIWAKNMHTSAPIPVAKRDERIWLFSRDGFKGNHFETTVWDEPIIPTWDHRRHKNEKPLGLMRRLIRFACKPGDVICDPFMGSGTTLRAAADLGHPCIGIDINEAYCKATVTRLAQRTLFAG
jgi:site-specific DNA-methyltransferase (adenine-specific)